MDTYTPLSLSEDSKSTPFFGSASSETDLLPNFFLRVDFNDRGKLETSNKQKVDSFWKYLASKPSLSSIMVLSAEDFSLRKLPSNHLCTPKEEQEKTKYFWTSKLRKLEALGYKTTATITTRKYDKQEVNEKYKSKPNDNFCQELGMWNKQYKEKIEKDPPPHWIAYKQ